MELAGKMALVTGASGFIGGHTARRLAIAEHMRVRALLRNPTGSTVVDLRHALIEPVCGDLLEPPSLEAACVGCDLIVHAATDTALTNRRLIRATSVDGTRNLLRAAGVAGAQRFIFISTFDVYFGSLKQFRDEDTPVHPFGDLYADGKILAEEVLLGSGTALPAIVVLRPPAVFGPGSREWTVQIIRDVQRDRLFLPGGGRFPFPYVFIDNLVDAIVAAARRETASGIYNIVDGRMTYREFVQPLVKLAGGRVHSIPFWLLWPAALISEGITHLTGRWLPLSVNRMQILVDRSRVRFASADKACNELGWLPQRDFAEGMRLTAEWLREHRYIK